MAAWGNRPVWWATPRPQLGSPSEQVALERPAQSARQIARAQAAISVLVSSVAVVVGLIVVLLPDGQRGFATAVLALVALAGAVLIALTDLWIGRALDILVRSGSQLRQSAAGRAADLARLNGELRRRDRERADLFATMSHELRTPLNAIIGHSRLLLDDLDGELNDEQRTDIRQIHDGGLGLLRIVNGTLDFARLEAGAATFDRSPVQVWAVAEEVIALLKPLATAGGLQLTSNIGAGLPPVLADEERLRQALVNLVGNALKFTASGWVRLDAEAAGDGVTISVHDSGVGIPDESKERIFEPFRQADEASDRSHEGTGLGLAITRRLVELMGGRIWVASTPGVGSTFSVSLARAAEPRTVTRGTTGDREIREPIDVALVSNHHGIDVLVSALSDHGIAARHFTGPDWPARVAAAAPRVVLADVQDRRVGGWRALIDVSADERLRDTRLGLVGVTEADGKRSGNALILSNLTVATQADLSIRLSEALVGSAGRSEMQGAPVIVIGADPVWRQRVTLQVQALGLDAHEAAHGEAGLSVVRRTPVLAVVADLTLGGPGIAELLAELQAALGRRDCPTFVVVPTGLSPSEQRDLRLGALSWLAADACPLPSLALEIAEQLTVRTSELVAAGGR
jgi:signal transduction histidine kinase/CheY-like chemotaxis protein